MSDMRILRVSFYLAIGVPPEAAIIAREGDLSQPFEEMLPTFEAAGVYAASDIFSMPEGTIEAAVVVAERRRWIAREMEMHQSTLFHYFGDMLARVSEGGTLTTSQPSPLAVEELRPPMKQLAGHPNYRHQTVLAHAKDGTVVQMKDREVKVL